MTQVLYCSTLFGALTLAAAIDAGRLGPGDQRRLVIVSDNGPTPEIGDPLQDSPGFAVLRSRADDIVSWNEFIAPLHPSGWTPSDVELPMLSRALLARLGLDGPPAELVLESIAVAPAQALARLLPDCPVTVYSDGLMSYGPTRSRLPAEIGSRVSRVLHLDLVPGLRPVLLREEGVDAEALPDEVFLKVLAEAATIPDFADVLLALPRGGALVLGQYLSALEIVTPQQEAALYGAMVRAAARAGHTRVLFKPHPAAGRAQVRAVRAVAADAGVQLTVVPEELPAELCFATVRPDLVLGCFSTALLTARAFYDLPVAAMGTERVLDALTPYQNSNRIPATIVDAIVPRMADDGTTIAPPAVDCTLLVEAVSFCMQPVALPDLRGAAQRWISEHGTGRYFRIRRLRAVGLLASSGMYDRLASSRVAEWDVARSSLVRARSVRASFAQRRRAQR
ncbi:polysialyltransferase family glycosyltransferase [uncultured Jatrophihabitans sp.]|uniref:polysialyltransferase family glycosyltransferase n=1 Tax=uncultured Jatrophihabitans sp. TaxID=1610747 RepID=UPI0035C98B7C